MTMLLPPETSDTLEVAVQAWRPRTDADLLAAQLRSLDEWHRRIAHARLPVPGQSREARLDDARRRDIAERERDAMHAWADQAMRDTHPFGRGQTPRAVVAHRNDWLRDTLCAGLRDKGVEVVASTGDGAVAFAAVVIEQPDLVFVEDLLPTLSGVELIRRARVLAPDAMVGAHALGHHGMAPLLDAGARATFSRRIPPAEIASELVACLHGEHAQLTLV